MPGPSSKTRFNFFRATLTPGSVATITTEEELFTVTGVKAGQACIVSAPSHVAGVAACNARVSADNQIAITFCNPTAGAVTPAAGEYLICTFDE